MTYEEQQEFLQGAEQKIAAHVAKRDFGAVGAQIGIREAAQRVAEHKAHAELQVEAARAFEAARIPERPIPFHATEFKCGGQTTTFCIGGRQCTFGEFRAELAKRGTDPERFEKRLAGTGKPERHISRSAVTAGAVDESSQ